MKINEKSLYLLFRYLDMEELRMEEHIMILRSLDKGIELAEFLNDGEYFETRVLVRKIETINDAAIVSISGSE